MNHMQKPMDLRPFWDDVLTGLFWSHVPEQPADECWEWAGLRDGPGYGMYQIGQSRWLRAHRVSWAIANGLQIAGGLQVCHKCDNPPCVRPDHLFIGTNSDNVRDCISKGRSRSGTGRLNALQVAEIRQLAPRGAETRVVAERYGVTPTAIRNIMSGKTWGWASDAQ